MMRSSPAFTAKAAFVFIFPPKDNQDLEYQLS